MVGIPDRVSPVFTAHTVVTFEDEGAGTRMTVRQRYDVHDAAARKAVEGAPEGWRTTLDKFAAEVARMVAEAARTAVHGEFTVERVYTAAPALVFRALTDVAAKARWFAGGDEWTLLERVMDIRRAGGASG